jgi:Mg-chelatase subunit ChlD
MLVNFVRRTNVLALLAVTAVPAFAQTAVSGVVQEAHGRPLANAMVSVTGTSIGGRTGADGRYRFEIPETLGTTDSVTLVARTIGYAPATRRVVVKRGPVTANFDLEASTLRLEGVIVTGTAGTDGGAPGVVKDRIGAMVAGKPVPAAAPAPVMEKRDARAKASSLAGARADKVSVRRGRGGDAVRQDPSPGVLTAAVWDDNEHWREYTRFLGKGSENAWNPWGLDARESPIRPVRSTQPVRSSRRALDIGFLVDATGSMGDEMTFLQSELEDIVRRVRGVEPALDIRMSVVFYRDRGDEFITKSLPFTRNVNDVVSFLSSTSAGGGGDFPEDMNAGLDAMMRQSWSRDAVPQMLFLLADAPPHQYAGEDYTYHEAIQDAAAKGIAIYPVAASGVDKPTEFLFRAMAVMTGGKYTFLTDDSGVGDSHEEPDIAGYTVEKLNDLMVREIRSFVSARVVGKRVADNR